MQFYTTFRTSYNLVLIWIYINLFIWGLHLYTKYFNLNKVIIMIMIMTVTVTVMVAVAKITMTITIMIIIKV